MKLTPAQIELLQECADKGSAHVVAYYSPAKALVLKGFAVWDEAAPGADRLTITDAGKWALLAVRARK